MLNDLNDLDLNDLDLNDLDLNDLDLNDLDLNDRFHVSSATFNAYFPVLLCFCNKLLIENDRKYYLSDTYVIFGIES